MVPRTSKHRKKVAPTFLQKHEQVKCYVNQMKNKITGRAAVSYCDEERSLFLAADQWKGAFLFLYTLLMQGMSGNLEWLLQNIAFICVSAQMVFGILIYNAPQDTILVFLIPEVGLHE